MTVRADQIRGSWKNPVRLASVSNLPLSGLAVVDGVAPLAGQRVLVKTQLVGADNGIYVAAAGAWVRAKDFDNVSDDAIAAGLVVSVQEGTFNGGKAFKLDTTGLIILGVTGLVFSAFGGGGGLHAPTHTDGTDDIQSATAAQKGLATAAQITKLNGIAAGAQVNNLGAPVSSVDLGRVVWSGTAGDTLDDVGLRDYGASATDPVAPAPGDGDTYRNTALDMQMYYDGTRAKWLGDSAQIAFGRAGNVGSGAYYRGIDRRSFSATNGRDARHNGTVVALEYTRNDTDAATFEATAAGVAVATLASSATSGSSSALDGDFAQGQVLGARNQAGGNTTSQTMGWITIRWRA